MSSVKLRLSMLFLSLAAVLVAHAETAIQIPVARVFVPSVGYDNNDHVQIVADGTLPNGCWALGRTTTQASFDVTTQKRILRLKQFAVRRDIKACTSGDLGMQEHMKLPVPFTSELSLGQLAASTYSVVYQNGEEFRTREFAVTSALTGNIDNFSYASVSNAYLRERVAPQRPVSVKLTGVHSSTCVEMPQELIEVERVGDVIIILPKLRVQSSGLCLFMLRPFEIEVPIGELSEGRYLVHVRSQNGQAINRVFSVASDTAPQSDGDLGQIEL